MGKKSEVNHVNSLGIVNQDCVRLIVLILDFWEHFGNVQELVKGRVPMLQQHVLLWHYPYCSGHEG